MIRPQHSLIAVVLLASGALAQSTDSAPWMIVPEADRDLSPMQVVEQRSPLGGLSGDRPVLSMTLPLAGERSMVDGRDGPNSAFSWSLKAWQLNTASLAHIQCSQGMLTIDSYVAQDCRFVDQPLPSDSVNLLQVSGDWTAAPGLQLGLSAFRSEEPAPTPNQPFSYDLAVDRLTAGAPDVRNGALEGLDFNVSFGIQTDRVGDFLLGLQLARYRQRMSLSDLGMPVEVFGPGERQYSNSAQLLLGWRHGSFSGEMLGHHRELPLWLGREAAPPTLNSFDLQFSWQALRNGSLSIGVSNIMDAAPRADDPKTDAGLEDPLESVYGRIPYVRYKQDL